MTSDLLSRIGPKHEDQGREIRAVCRDCQRETTHTIAASAEYDSSLDTGGFSIRSWDEYQVIECKGCQTIGFRHCNRNTENSDHDERGNEFLIETIQLYPEQETVRPRIRDTDLLPVHVSAVYEETISALGAGLRVLAGVGLRTLVESMCTDRQAKGGTLEKKIDSLVDQGVVSAEGAEILHSLRIMGNRAAHEVVPHSLADLNVGMNVIEHALQGIYILPAQAAKLPKRRSSAGADKGEG